LLVAALLIEQRALAALGFGKVLFVATVPLIATASAERLVVVVDLYDLVLRLLFLALSPALDQREITDRPQYGFIGAARLLRLLLLTALVFWAVIFADDVVFVGHGLSPGTPCR
jgi:hypothetical protein